MLCSDLGKWESPLKLHYCHIDCELSAWARNTWHESRQIQVTWSGSNTGSHVQSWDYRHLGLHGFRNEIERGKNKNMNSGPSKCHTIIKLYMLYWTSIVTNTALSNWSYRLESSLAHFWLTENPKTSLNFSHLFKENGLLLFNKNIMFCLVSARSNGVCWFVKVWWRAYYIWCQICAEM